MVNGKFIFQNVEQNILKNCNISPLIITLLSIKHKQVKDTKGTYTLFSRISRTDNAFATENDFAKKKTYT